MKVKLKSILALSVLTALFSSQAMAIDTSAASAELFLVAYNSTGSGSTYIATLSPSTFASVANFTGSTGSASLDLTGANYGTAWSTFASQAGFSTSTVYEVLGVNVGASSSAVKILTTSVPAILADGSNGNLPTNQNLGTARTSTNSGSLYAFLSDTTTGNGFITGSGASASTFIAGSGVNTYAGGIGNNFAGSLSMLATNQTLGSSVDFFALTRNANGTLSGATSTALGSWNLSNSGTLSYTAVAAVPESDPLSMMLVGIGLVGFVASRRLKKTAA